ncbi:glycosyltransferase [uncultured Arcticibacterium sp.]|uniref:glycosyltransferase n=1 Tax=uncultured Arcticibacterium sp. TaxID=2173042 RepID=UPI0030F8285B
MIWDYIFPAIFGTAILIQLIFLLFVFTAILKREGSAETEVKSKPLGVSIIVAAWNELDNLKELLPLLDNQEYPNFEIVVVDDRSSDGTYDYLRTNEGAYKNLSFVNVKALPEHFTAKKYAVTMGIKKATKEVILLTDADCRPLSKNWIKEMVAKLSDGKEVVLGFSPYNKYPGILNAFIRYETFQTALQYMSFAKVGIPFMGVGRNLMYRRECFWQNKGFSTHMGLLSGDDDLFINEVSKGSNTEIALNYDSYVSSEPKTTFDSWVTQKRRHLSVGKKYKARDKFSIAMLWLSFLACWFFIIPAFVSEPSWFVLPDWMRVSEQWLDEIGWQQYLPYTNWMRVVTGVFISWLLLRWLILSLTNKKLGLTVSSGKILLLDFLYFTYLVVFGIMSLFSNPKKIKWR